MTDPTIERIAELRRLHEEREEALRAPPRLDGKWVDLSSRGAHTMRYLEAVRAALPDLLAELDRLRADLANSQATEKRLAEAMGVECTLLLGANDRLRAENAELRVALTEAERSADWPRNTTRDEEPPSHAD